MKVAEVTYEQALTLDPALIGAGQAICVRLSGVRAVIGPVPPHVAPGLIQGELRDDQDRPLKPYNDKGLSVNRTAPATREGLRDIIAALDALARNETGQERVVSAMLFDGFPDPPRAEPETKPETKLSRDRRRTLRQRKDVDNGIHPLRRHLPTVTDGQTCGDCSHLERTTWTKTYLKCGLVPNTHGPGTDARAWWPACTDWTAIEAPATTGAP